MHARSTAPNHIEAVFPFPDAYLAVFSGPHGKPIRVEEYGVIVLIVSGWGLMAQMPYPQMLIRGHREGVMKARRILTSCPRTSNAFNDGHRRLRDVQAKALE